MVMLFIAIILCACMHMQILGRWDSHVYHKYVETADLDKREWMETNGDRSLDPIFQIFNVFGTIAPQ